MLPTAVAGKLPAGTCPAGCDAGAPTSLYHLLLCCRYGIFPAESVDSRVQRAKAACQHSKCRFLPELINTAADTLGSDAEAIKRFTALQQRFGFTHAAPAAGGLPRG